MGIALLASLQSIIGNRLTQVMNGMAANIGGEPVEQRWQLQVTGAVHCAIHGLPIIAGMGVGAREVVLHKEDADEDRRAAGHHRGIDQPESASAEPPGHADPAGHHGEVVEQQIPKSPGFDWRRS